MDGVDTVAVLLTAIPLTLYGSTRIKWIKRWDPNGNFWKYIAAGYIALGLLTHVLDAQLQTLLHHDAYRLHIVSR